MALSPGTRLGAYDIAAKLGEGGMGEIYRARDTKLDRDVALKILPAEYTQDAERVRRFRQEAAAASALNHPNIVTIHEAGEAAGYQFIATEFIDGETVRQILKRSGRLPIGESMAIAVQVAAALTAAHRAGIVHRDVKPENVMRRPDGYVKVLDFGIAKLTQRDSGAIDADTQTRPQAHTEAGAMVGTLPYMSPEQARGTGVDARTDIWSLGCLLYEMLSGQVPFAGATTTDLLVAIVEREPAPIAPRVEVPAELDWIIAKTLRKSPAERYQSAEELLGDLRRLQQKVELESHQQRAQDLGAAGVAPPVRAARASRVPRRVRTVSVGVVLIAALLASGWWYWRRTGAPLSIEAHSLAVLPLKSLDAGEHYLGLGIADAVIRKTSQTGALIVRPTSAIRRYVTEDTDALTAARQLSADVVLEGSVQRAGERLRVSVNLLRVSDGASIWADSFDMRMTDIFEIQDTVAQQVASHLRLTLDRSQQARMDKRQTANPVAYEFYLRGLHNFDQRMTSSAADRANTIGFLVKAIETDPAFALAHAQLAYVYASNAVFEAPAQSDLADRARKEIERALALDPELPEIALARSQLLFSRFEGFQIEAAVRVLLDAQKLNPNIGHADLGYLYTHLGLPDLAERAVQRALEIDPTSAFARGQLLGTYELSGQFERWREAYQRLQPNEPLDPWVLVTAGRLDEAQRVLDRGDPRATTFGQFLELPSRAVLAGLKGDMRAAEGAIPSLLSRHPVKNPYYHHAAFAIACIHAIGGKSADAVKWLREAVATGLSTYPLFERSPLLDRIRQAPEFVQFMAELKETTDRYRRELESVR